MADRDVEALAVPLQIGDKVAGDYTEFKTDGHMRRVGAAVNSRASMFTSLPGTYTTVLATAGTYYKISGTFLGYLLSRFTVNAAGTLAYTGDGEVVSIMGTSDMHCDKACELEYVIYLNGVRLPGTTSHHTVTAASKNSNLAITGLIDLNTSDTLEIYAMSDTTNTTLTIRTLRITALGV